MTEKEKEERILDKCGDEADADDSTAWRCPCCGTDNPDSERMCAECGKYRF